MARDDRSIAEPADGDESNFERAQGGGEFVETTPSGDVVEEDLVGEDEVGEDEGWFDAGIVTLLLVGGLALFLFPEPATSGVGVLLMGVGVIAWIVDWLG